MGMNGKDLPYGVGVLVVKDGKFLCGLRSDNLEICGPGGHVEKGENAEDAARREAKEEFGITPKKLIPLGVISDENDAFKPAMCFACMDYEGEPKADGKEIRPEGFGFNDVSEIKKKGGRLSPAFEASIKLLTDKLMNTDGGHGSGNFGHSGRPGKKGGSGSGGGLDAKLAGYVKSMNPEERKMYDEAVAESEKARANVDKFMKANKESWNEAKTAVANGKTPITGTEAKKDHTIVGGSAEAQAIYDKARAAEPKISKDLIGVAASQGNEMYGLAYSVKTGNSMADKIARKQKDHPNDSDVKIVGKMGDMVRYTELTKHDNIAQTTQKTVLDLKNKGYKITEVDNKYLDKNSDYKGVHVSAVKDGQVFELQIHSEESMRVKERLHPMYETSRKVDTPPLVAKALQTKMKQISQTLPTPKGIDQVKSFKE